MKPNKVLSIALPIILLTGCGGEDKIKEKAEAKQEEKQESKKVAKTHKVPAEFYKKDINAYCKYLEDDFKAYNNELSHISDNTTTREAIIDRIKRLERTIDMFNEVDPPKEYADVHKDVESSMEHFSKAMKLSKEVFSRKEMPKGGRTDKELLEESDNEIKKGDEYWFKFIKELGFTEGSPNRAITEAQLNELDNKEGTNLEAVEKNVVDGTELIANWGFETKNGFQPSLILKGGNPKQFEVYLYGDYPKKGNHIEGTWIYDVPSKELRLHIDKQFVNGQEAEVIHKDLKYKVQNYDKKNLQLFNQDSMKITRYTKQM
ncbi:DUF3994 domain-containing protein [Bacillus paramycoides]|uniref:DUF3994 domain-containing protein n=1 Tax=Bacillus paramycoides TaxID=2026194 RepID=A0ABU6N7S0_9BACI|nr:DUF3994 domain-containing protein [Bacillus paramycoides]